MAGKGFARRPGFRWLCAIGLVSSASLFAPALIAQVPSEITVVTDYNYPPYLFTTENGELQGIIRDKWALWSRKTGVPANVIGMEWSDAQQAVLNGEADVIETIVFTPERAKRYDYSPPYAQIAAHIYFHQGVSGINDVASLHGFKVGAKRSSACGEWLARHGIELAREYPTSELLVLAAGRGDERLFCMDHLTAQYYLFKHGLDREFRVSPPLYTTQFHWAVKKDSNDIREFVQAGFEKIQPDEINAIETRWTGSVLGVSLPVKLLYYLLAAIAIVFIVYALLIGSNRILRARISAGTAELRGVVSRLKLQEELLLGQKQILEMIAEGKPLSETLDGLLRILEAQFTDMLCSILLLDLEGKHVRHGAAPSLPREYMNAIDGEPIGENAGSCGTAAFLGEAVIVEDIASDPRWERYRDFALRHDLRACWSTPIFDTNRRVLGTFAMYFKTPRRPDPQHFQLIDMATHTAAIAIVRQREQSDLRERVKELTALYRFARALQDLRPFSRALLQELVMFLPPAFQFPEICQARIQYGDDSVNTPGWRATPWILSAAFMAGDGRTGAIDVVYIEPRIAGGNDLFLEEERRLLQALADMLSAYLDRIYVETALRDSEVRFRAIFENAAIGIGLVDIDGRLVDCNPALSRLLGYSREELCAMTFPQFTHPDDIELDMQYYRELIAGQRESYQLEKRFIHKNGETIWMQLIGSLMRGIDGAPRFAIGMVEDLTARKQAEQALHEANEQLQIRIHELARSNIDLQQFAYVASHDLQTPLRSISGFLQLLIEHYRGKLDEQADEWINRTVESTQRMQQLIRDLLEYARVDSRARPFQPVDLREVFEETLKILELPIRESGADITCGTLPILLGERALLVQLMQNLIGNAIKYRSKERPPKIHVSAEKAGNKWWFAVRDNGIGIDPKYHERIFQIFRRLHNQQTYPGSGIGLAICQRIVHFHGGEIRVESRLNEGSTFYFSIPEKYK